jgi:N-acetylneuraminic acid mutarotase
MRTFERILSIIAIAGLVLTFAASSSKAQQIITYQGLAQSNGTALNGSHNVALAIYTDSTGGVAKYQESQLGVTFTNGLFNIEIGTNPANPLPIFQAGNYSGSIPAPNYFLGISIDGGQELTPRSKLGTSPTSFSSRFADSARVAGNGSLPSGAIVAFPNNSARAGYTYTGAEQIIPGGAWSNGTAMPVGQGTATSAVVNGLIYVIGGFYGSQNNNQIYNPVANTWSTGAVLPVAQNAPVSAVVNGLIYVIGGTNGSQNNNQIYNPVTNTWTTGAAMPVGQYTATSAVVNGLIYVIGGASGSQNNVQIYNPVANSWSTGAVMPVGQYYATSAVVNGLIYVIGGGNGNMNNQIYNPASNTWSQGAVLPVGQTTATSTVVNGLIYVIGGYYGGQNNQIYNPVANTWSTGAVLPVGEDYAMSAVVGGQIYVIGGANGNTNVQIYTPGPQVVEYFFTVN